MTTTEQKPKNRITPYTILVTEILIFYGGAGWLLGIWNLDYSKNHSDLQLTVTFFYVFGVLTFLFFTIAIPPSVAKQPFIRMTTIFTLTATPCILFSISLTNALWLNRPYTQSLEKVWDTKHEILQFLIPHVLGFILALSLRKLIKPVKTSGG